MSLSSLFGVIFGIIVLYVSLASTTPNLGMFFDVHGLIVVFGGTFAAASICFPIGKIFLLLKVFIQRVLGKRKADFQGVVSQLLELNKKATIGTSALKESLPTIKHDFLKEAIELVATGVLTESEIRNTLERRVKTLQTEYMHEADMFRVIGKFPPAFGLMATTLGMIALLQKIGEPGSEKLIGPAMSVGLVGTLYGITLANLVFNPIAENLTERTKEEVVLRKLIIEGALLLKAQVNPIAMRETLNSYLLPKNRVVKKAAA